MADNVPAPIEAYDDPSHFIGLLRSDAELARWERRDLARLLERLAQEAADWRRCAKYGETPEGRKPNGFRRAELERCRQKYIDGAK